MGLLSMRPDRFRPAVVDFGRQREWRWLIAIAFYVGGLGAGTFLISLYFKFLLGMIVGYLIVVVLKSGAHILYLGHPLRFWRAFLTPQTSWISRGLIFVAGFTVFGFLYLIAHFPLPAVSLWQEGSILGDIIKVLTIFFGLAIMVYTGFAMAYSPAMPFWNTSLLPLLFLIYSFLGGASFTLGMTSLVPEVGFNVEVLERIEIWLIVLTAFTIFTYLLSMMTSSVGAVESTKRLLWGDWAIPFWLGVVFLGMLLPLIIGCYFYFHPTKGAPLGLVVAGTMEFIGGFIFRLSILQVGVYNPLILGGNNEMGDGY